MVRVLLDECVPRKLKYELPRHETRTVQEMGWSGTENGELLARAANNFDVVLTVDQKIQSEHDLSEFGLALVVLRAQRTTSSICYRPPRAPRRA
jgi:hypothetical protein